MKPVKFIKLVVVLGGFALFLPGCFWVQPDSRPAVVDTLPSHYSMYTESTQSLPGITVWWAAWDSPELNRLMAQGLGDNFSIREARARLDQARALQQSRHADLFPSLKGEAGYSGTEARKSGGSETHSLKLAAAYEVDLWGRIFARRTAGDLGVEAGQADVDAAAVTLAAQLAEYWIDLIAVRMETALIRAQIQTNQKIESLLLLRFEKSISTALDYLQQQKAVQRAQAKLPALEAREILLTHQIALLLGKAPGAAPELTTHVFPRLPPLPPLGIPADLLAMRPDVRAAGLRLRAADWEVAASRADRLPALSISAGYTYQGERLASVFDNWIANLAANLTGPIFDAGKKEAQVEEARARALERLAAYQRTVVTAVKEVEESLVNETMQTETLALLETEIKTGRLLLSEAERHYTRGLDTYLPVVSALVQNQELEVSRVRRQAELIKYRIGLHRRLGGSWPQDLEPRDARMEPEK